MTEATPENDLLQSLIAEILDAEARGDSVNRDEILRKHPQHENSLREFFANHDSMKDGGNGPEEVTLPPAGPTPDDATLPPVGPGGDDATLPPLNNFEAGKAKVGDKVRYFGGYELLEEIARGGMGVVYKARQINLNRIVALKMILSGQLASEEDVKRFYTEAEAAANLDHPGIVPIFEIGEHQGQHYFSMGYIEGQSLAQRIADGPVPPRVAAELVKKICDAMAYAHKCGVIHRDLKPANVLLDQNGQPKVTDFGLAKQLNVDSGLTGTAQILGTPAYMPPEQASGKVGQVGRLADVYSLGAILYCLLTGRPPFQAASPMETLMQVLDQEPVSPELLNPQVPRDLKTICLKCIEKVPTRRYHSATELGDEIFRYLTNRPIVARPASSWERIGKWIRRRPAMASLLAVCVVSLGALLATLTWSNLHYQRLLEREQRIAYGNQISFADSSWRSGDYRRAEQFLNDTDARFRSWEWDYLNRIIRGETLSVRTGNGNHHFAVGPRRNLIATVTNEFRGGNLTIWNTVTGKPVQVLEHHETHIASYALSADGSIAVTGTNAPIVDGGSTELLIWSVEKPGEVRKIVLKDRIRQVFASPDGKYAVSVTGIHAPFRFQLWDAATGSALLQFATDVSTVAFSPDGQHIAIQSLENFVEGSHSQWVSFGRDGQRFLRRMAIRKLPNGEVVKEFEVSGAAAGLKQMTFSPDGSLYAASYDDGLLQVCATNNWEMSHTFRATYAESIAFSPDGRLLATIGSDSDDISSLKIWDTKLGELLRTIPGATGAIAFSLDGKSVATGSPDHARIWRIEDSQEYSRVGDGTLSFAPGAEIAVSGDGETIAVSEGKKKLVVTEMTENGIPTISTRQETVDVAFWSINGSEAVPLGEIFTGSSENSSRSGASFRNHIWDVMFLPNQESLVAVSSLDGSENSPPCDITVWDKNAMDVRWSLQRPATDRLSALAVSSDGRYLVVGGRSNRVEVLDANTGVTVLRIPTRGLSLAISPNGKTIATASGGFGEGLGDVCFWSTQSGQLENSISTSGAIVDLAFSPDGKYLAAANDDRVTLLRLGHFESRFEIDSEPFGIKTVCFTMDSQRLLVAGKELELWDVLTQRPLISLQRHGGDILSATFNGHGKKLVTFDDRGEVRIWPR